MWLQTMPPRRRDALAALLTFAAGMGLYLLGVRALIPEQDGLVPLWVRVAVYAFACAGQLIRSTRPLPAIAICLAGVATDLAISPSLPMLFVVTDVCFVAVLYTSRRASRIAFVTICVIAVGLAFAASIHDPDWRHMVLGALQIIGLFAIPLWWATNVRNHAEIAESERARARQLQRIAELGRQAAVDAERSTMARDLHDVIAGHLSGIAIQSEAALSMMDSQDTVRSALGTIRADSVTALEEMRAMIGLLRSGGRAGETSPEAPHRLSDLEPLLRSARAAGTPLTVHSDIDEPLPAAVDIAGYRIVQEALTNARKHAAGRPAAITLRWTGTALDIEVSNELGDTPGEGTGLGVANMSERARDLGGTATIGRRGDRWLVAVSLPCSAEVLR